MGSNKLVPLVGSVIVLFVLFVGIKACTQTDQHGEVTLASVPESPAPDKDSPADTVRTLTARVADLTTESQLLQQQNAKLLRQREEITRQVKQEMRNEFKVDKFREGDPAINKLTSQFGLLKSRLEEVSVQQNQALENQLSQLPVGLGFDEANVQNPDEIIWSQPLGGTILADTATAIQTVENIPSPLLQDQSSNPGEALPDTAPDQETTLDSYLRPAGLKKQPDRPVYTVPRNATLIGSVGMTALIGRIPTDGVIKDPFPFKAIVGKDNLAANGITMPGLSGMIFSGKSTGDWALSCVRGELLSVTYVFDDGTIRTLSSDDNSLQQFSRNKGSGGDRPLGFISDRRGIPCVSGQKISNTSDYLLGRILAKAISAGSQAIGQNETTQIVSPLAGTSTSIVTGDKAKHAGLNALAGGTDEISQYLAERVAQSFDVIYVDTGMELALHIDQELPIDYEPHGRKTDYAVHAHAGSATLD